MNPRFFTYLALCLQSWWALAETPPSQVSIGSYNLENLWDHDKHNTVEAWKDYKDHLPNDIVDQLPPPPQYSFYSAKRSNWYSPRTLNAKIKSILHTIRLSGTPTILALQELESAGNNSKVWDIPYHGRSTFKKELQKLGYKYFILGEQEEDNPVAVTTAVISKVPISAEPSVKIRFGYSTSARDVQVVQWDLPNNSRLLIFNGHFKSKAGGGKSQRILTAQAVAKRIKTELAKPGETHIMVTGDLNTSYYEEPLQHLGSTGDERLMLGRPTRKLYNLWYELKEQDRWEHSFSGERGTLSHMLISHGLYKKYGLSYVDQSFKVVGQKGKAAKVLLSPEGIPYRWQIRKYFARAVHINKGYSDHLPLVARFKYSPAPTNRQNFKKHITNPSTEQENLPPKKILFNKVKKCKRTEVKSFTDINWKDKSSYYGKCVRFDFDEPAKLEIRGRFRHNFFRFHVRDENGLSYTHQLGISMMRNYDWRPNIDDSRISYHMAAIPKGRYNWRRAHPRSNLCFARRVLQGSGGALKYAVGRIAYQDGHLSLLVTSREKRHIKLVDLPPRKESSCPWSK